MRSAPDKYRAAFRWLSRVWPAVIAIAATYIYFLLFAQFAFLHFLEAQVESTRLDAGLIEMAMAAMGLAGLASSFFVGRFHPPGAFSLRWLTGSFGLCAGAACLSLWAAGFNPVGVMATSAAVGVGTAFLTVSLAIGLKDLADGAALGPVVGAGTGLAYWACNIPCLFAGSVRTQSAAVIVVCTFVAAAIWLALKPGSRRHMRRSGKPPLLSPWHVIDKAKPGERRGEPFVTAEDLGGLGFLSVVLSFLVLIWLDSAAFVIIQETFELKGMTWAGSDRQWLLGGVHAVAAVTAGWLLERGVFRSLLLGAFALFTLAFTVLMHLGAWAPITGPIYAIGISFYSTALVAYAAAETAPGHRRSKKLAKCWRAATVFGVGGWLGSALGVGMAQDLHRIPALFIWITGLVLVLGVWMGSRGARGHGRSSRRVFPSSRLVKLWAPTLTGAILAMGLYQGSADAVATPRPSHAPETQAPSLRGQGIYIREGCLHCHSQYIRPGTEDELAFGPGLPIDREAGPVLIGNRRLGPDLSRVGDRRDPAWLEEHLKAPRELSPGSRMPSYAHLFDGSTGDGEHLVAYLQSLRQP